MTVVELGELVLDRCQRCEGIWYDRGELEEHLVYRKEASSSVPCETSSEFPKRTLKRVAVSRTELDVSILRDVDGQRRPCARCERLMSRRNFGGVSGVIVDSCGYHGLFLERGEFRKLERFVASGGLAFSSQREEERAKGSIDSAASRYRSGISRQGPAGQRKFYERLSESDWWPDLLTELFP